MVRPIKPDLDDHHYIYLTAFYDLSTCRSVGGEMVGDIPFTAVVEWLRYWRINREDSEIYLEVIPRLDKIFLDHVYTKRKESLDKANRGSGSGGFKRAQPNIAKARRKGR